MNNKKLKAIIQDYLGAIPADKHCLKWSELQHKMFVEINKVIGDQSDDLYYIQSGYVGNAMLWWAQDSRGYTTHFEKAGKFTKKEAISNINNKPREDSAWLCSHVDECKAAHILVIETGNLDTDFRIMVEEKL